MGGDNKILLMIYALILSIVHEKLEWKGQGYASIGALLLQSN